LQCAGKDRSLQPSKLFSDLVLASCEFFYLIDADWHKYIMGE